MSAADAPDIKGAAAGREGGRRPWQGRRILLGVTGGIAAYKSIQLARDLTQLGAVVDVILSHSARAFVGELSFEALTGRPVHSDILAPGHALDHIRLAREADVVCVAPATADFVARAAQGRSDDLLTAVLLATRAPVIICPAMNDRMWSHTQTQSNALHLRHLGYHLVGPGVGPLAFGEGEGPGRVVEPSVVIQHIGRELSRDARANHRTLLVSAGPTREQIDPVRVITNRSSGRMGYAIAGAAWRRGFHVHLVTGPVSIPVPEGVEVTPIETAEDMADAIAGLIPHVDAVVMAAAVADFRPVKAAANKLKKTDAMTSLALEAAPDVLMNTRAMRKPGAIIIGFALETENLIENGRTKLAQKDLDMIVMNSATEFGAGFEIDTNRVTLLCRDGKIEEVPLQSKDAVADIIIDRLLSMLEHVVVPAAEPHK